MPEKMNSGLSKVPLTLYAHIPWCVQKCPYCDFNSYRAPLSLPERAYVEALLADLEQELSWLQGRCIESIFLGGGTPSLFSAEAIERLLARLRMCLPLSTDIEVTLEANPGTIEQQKFREFFAAGINRLSIGVQSFHEEHLHRLGRIHGQQEAFHAAEAAHKAGFVNVNLDLMFGLPGQTLPQALADIDNAVALNPAHISHYQLTLEPHTSFYRRPPLNLPDEDRLWEMQSHCQERLAKAGYAQYEVSAYARAQQYCRHNLNYWEFGDYLGIGAGAHGKLSDMVGTGGIQRFWKLRNPQAYLSHVGSERVVAGSRLIPPSELGLEFMMNALRLVAGFPAGLFSERTGLPLTYVEPALSLGYAQGLLSRNEQRIQATELGRRFLNNVLELFMPEETQRC